MAKPLKQKTSDQTIKEALGIARNIQRPEQTKEQTKLIAQGIEKGIDLYKKQQKAKARELDKALKKAKYGNDKSPIEIETSTPETNSSNRLPWLLLACSWLFFIITLWLVTTP